MTLPKAGWACSCTIQKFLRWSHSATFAFDVSFYYKEFYMGNALQTQKLKTTSSLSSVISINRLLASPHMRRYGPHI